ncbi:leucine-rich repeat-containing protein 40-like [Argiope bruennichi]|uniref:leucine-rich repeat-containing protein 40-like n=1 Tax=Argiope bruennichi TaxID=94029 RepID=UPI0024945B9E|nr:leucine-rich repeat-containing protein 40-like [Argiope bruennichi]XP_055942290.1 leucine-rich repeat-containing protein 40-like [Argiope bruennichi]
MSSKLQEIKAKALAEKKKQVSSAKGNVESCFFRQLKEASLHPRIIKQARKSGVLNLSNRGIAEMPDIVWNITSLTAEETKELSVSIDSSEDDKWWDYVDLTKLVLASNTLRYVSPDISNYKRLNVLDLHDNCLSDLPSSVGELTCLTKLNISRNQFEVLPDCIFSLKSLKSLQAQHNKLHHLNDDIGNLSFLEELDLSYNNLKKLPHCIGFLSRVTFLNLSNNELAQLPVEMGDMMALKHLDLSKNKLKSLPSLMEMLHHLEQLYIQHNNITELPILTNCKSLKEIHAGFNSIKTLSTEFLEAISNIKLLDLRDNKISEIPDTICSLQALERLDISNNALSSLPFTLGTLPHLKFLSIDGNPMRTIRRDIIQRGTVQLLRWLRSRIEDPSLVRNMSRLSCEVDGAQNNTSNCDVDKYAVKSTRSLPLSNKNMTSIPKDVIETARDAEVTTVDLSKNSITSIPDEFEMVLSKLTELNLGYNKLNSIPSFIGLGQHLQYLDLRNNQLQTLPAEIANLSSLREINICYNRFHSLPSALYGLKKLEIILASDNQIEDIDANGLSQIPTLAVLDLHNNSIKVVPPELGNLRQLRSLLLDGNLFRNPRPAILSKGTPALLEFLRSRIPQS